MPARGEKFYERVERKAPAFAFRIGRIDRLSSARNSALQCRAGMRIAAVPASGVLRGGLQRSPSPISSSAGAIARPLSMRMRPGRGSVPTDRESGAPMKLSRRGHSQSSAQVQQLCFL